MTTIGRHAGSVHEYICLSLLSVCYVKSINIFTFIYTYIPSYDDESTPKKENLRFVFSREKREKSGRKKRKRVEG